MYRLDASRTISVPEPTPVCFNNTSRRDGSPPQFITSATLENTPMGVRSIAAALALAITGLAAAEDWPGWRGPRSDGTVSDSGYPLEWSATRNVKWKTPLPGTGHSSPVVCRGKVFVTGCIEAE